MENVGQQINYNGIKYTPTEINRAFKIKVMRFEGSEMVKERIVGVSGLIEEVGKMNIVNTLLTRAFNSGNDKVECKLRRGLRVIFFSQ